MFLPFILSSCGIKQSEIQSSLQPDKIQSGPTPSSESKTTEKNGDELLSEEEKARLEKEKIPTSSPDELLKQNQSDDQIMSEAIASKDPKKCQEIKNEDYQKTCVNNVNDVLKLDSVSSSVE